MFPGKRREDNLYYNWQFPSLEQKGFPLHLMERIVFCTCQMPLPWQLNFALTLEKQSPRSRYRANTAEKCSAGGCQVAQDFASPFPHSIDAQFNFSNNFGRSFNWANDAGWESSCQQVVFGLLAYGSGWAGLQELTVPSGLCQPRLPWHLVPCPLLCPNIVVRQLQAF